MSELSSVYRIRNWDQQFETRGSRKHHRPLAKVSFSTTLDGLVLRRLLSHPQGAAAYGVWVLLVQIAAKMPLRGTLADQTGAYTAADLSLLTGIPEGQVVDALEVLCSPRIGLLEQVLLESAGPAVNDHATSDVSLAAAAVTPAEPVADGAAAASSGVDVVLEPSPQPPAPEPTIPVPFTSTPDGPRRLPNQFPQQNLQVPGLPEFRKLLNAPAHQKKSRQFV